MNRAVALFVALLPLSACAGEGRPYPSLAPRVAEKSGFAEPVVAPTIVAPDPALDVQIAARSADLTRIVAGFTAAAEAARRSAGAAARQPVGSEAWLTAQAALAQVDDWRARATALASEIEAAGSARAALLPPYAALDALRERASAETDREAQAAADLQALLPAA